MDGNAIKNRVLRQFGDQFQGRIIDADIVEWINTGMREVAQKNELLQVTATIALVSGQFEYSFPANIMNLVSIAHRGDLMRGLGFTEFMQVTRDSTGVTTGVPTSFTTWADKIRVFPTPDSSVSGETIQVFYLRLPNEITLLTETPELPTTYHQRLVEYCLAQAAEMDENPQQYNNKLKEFQGNLDELKDNVDWTEREAYPTISVSPDDYGDHVGVYWRY